MQLQTACVYKTVASDDKQEQTTDLTMKHVTLKSLTCS